MGTPFISYISLLIAYPNRLKAGLGNKCDHARIGRHYPQQNHAGLSSQAGAERAGVGVSCHATAAAC